MITCSISPDLEQNSTEFLNQVLFLPFNILVISFVFSRYAFCVFQITNVNIVRNCFWLQVKETDKEMTYIR